MLEASEASEAADRDAIPNGIDSGDGIAVC